MALMFFATLLCQAQKKPGFIPPSIDDDEIPVVKTDLPVPEEGKDYVVRYFKGTTDGVESRIAVKNLGYIIRPAMVQVIAEDGRELSIELVKKNWDDVVRSGKTKGGKFESSFKTAMEFGIKISAEETGIPFIVAVSAGIELFPPTNLFVDASTKRSSAATDEAGMVGQESEESNKTLYIIIAGALIGILVLLAIFVFKKKGKGTASMIILLTLSISAEAGLVRNLGNSISGEVATDLANNLIQGLGNRYGRGDFGGDDPLTEDDKNYEPELDPRGQPSLPSSCYEIARMGRSGFSGSGGSASGMSGAKNPTNNLDYDIAVTTGIGGIMAGGSSGSETGADVGQEDSKDRDFDKERQKLNEDYQRDLEQAENVYELGIIDAEDNYKQSSREASKQLERELENANGDAGLITQAQGNHNTRVAQLSVTHATTNAQLLIDYSREVGELGARLATDLTALAEEESSQQNNDGGEKDPNRQPKKDPDREEGKGVGDAGKGVDPPIDGENRGPNSPTIPPGSNGQNGVGDRENEAGCRCLEVAYADLQKQRYRLEKLLKIGQHTKKVTDFGISFGDDFAGIHAVSGLAWQKQRAEVLKSIDQFDITYNNKYKEIIDDLYNALIQIDECETQLGYENWYSQSGFIYYEFMKVRYASYK